MEQIAADGSAGGISVTYFRIDQKNKGQIRTGLILWACAAAPWIAHAII